jgi:hypothetical protein
MLKSGDRVEYAGYRLGSINRGPERRHRSDGWYLVTPLNRMPGDGYLPSWYPERMLALADMTRWEYSATANTYRRIYPKGRAQ